MHVWIYSTFQPIPMRLVQRIVATTLPGMISPTSKKQPMMGIFSYVRPAKIFMGGQVRKQDPIKQN